MTETTFVHDPDLTHALGEHLAREVQDAIQPGGDCSACGKALGAGPLRVDVRGDESLHLVHARHASCRPVPDVEGLLVARGQNTYLVNAAASTLFTAGKPTPWWSFRRAQPGREVPVVVILINPSIDIFFIPSGQKSLIAPYLDREGFDHPGNVLVGGTDSTKSGFSLDVNDTGVTVIDSLGGARYEIDDSQPLADMIREYGGALVALTFKHWIGALDEDPGTLGRIMTDPDQTAITWLSC